MESKENSQLMKKLNCFPKILILYQKNNEELAKFTPNIMGLNQ